MSGQWKDSTRRNRLPRDWEARRRRVLLRDGNACQVKSETGIYCNAPANEVDHIERGDDHSLTNLRAICTPHHRAKSSAEGVAARAAKRASRARPDEPHPGLTGG